MTQEDGEKYGIAFTRMNIPGYDGNASAAYRTAYDAPDTSDDAVRIEAYRLRKNPHIALAIQRFHQSKAVETMLTLEAHMHDTAMASGKLGAAVRAEFLRGRAMGFYSDKTEHVATNEFARVTNLIDEQTKALDLVPAPKVSTKLRLKH